MKYVELFAGVGGFRLGIERAFYANRGEERGEQEDSQRDKGERFQSTQRQDTSTKNRRTSERPTDITHQRPFCVFANEWDKYAAQTYNKNFKGEINQDDITTISTNNIPDHDLLVGGFPCQAFSVAGRRLGFDDTRGTLFFQIARILADKRPQHLVLENVKGLLSHDSGKTFTTILGVLSDLGYCVEWQVLNSKDFGVPQNRERVFIVGHLRDGCRCKVFPLTRESNKNTTIGKSAKTSIARTLTAGGHSGGYHSGMTILHNIYGGFGETKVREFKDISPTIRTPKGGGHLPVLSDGIKIRRLTPVECERLQGFPDNWTEGVSDTQRYKQMGNAVTVNVIEAIMRKLYDKS